MNKAVIDEDKIKYELLFKQIEKNDDSNLEKTLIISNPYELKIRTDKVLADILKISRSEIKRMIKNKVIYSDSCDKLGKGHVGRLLNIRIMNKK